MVTYRGKGVERHGDISNHMAQEISYGNVEMEIVGGWHIWKRTKCPFQDMGHISLRGRLSHAHRECPHGRAICQYSPTTLPNMGNF